MVNGYRLNGIGFGEALLVYLSAGIAGMTPRFHVTSLPSLRGLTRQVSQPARRRLRTMLQKTVDVTQLLPNPNIIGPQISPV